MRCCSLLSLFMLAIYASLFLFMYLLHHTWIMTHSAFQLTKFCPKLKACPLSYSAWFGSQKEMRIWYLHCSSRTLLVIYRSQTLLCFHIMIVAVQCLCDNRLVQISFWDNVSCIFIFFPYIFCSMKIFIIHEYENLYHSLGCNTDEYSMNYYI